jgi:alpha-mannosidase
VFHVRRGEQHGPQVTADPLRLENDLIRIGFDRQGRLRRVYDKAAERHVLPPGAVGNQLILFEDKPHNWDAWDIDIFYNDKPLERDGKLISAEVMEQGSVRSVVRFVRRISKSVITQDVVLTAGSSRIDFETSVAWADERDVLLKAAFPVRVRAERARYEIQFGNVERPTHWNLPQDFSRFEVPAQKWVDLSEGDYGVALLNDCKYGHDTRGNVMRLSLLRAPKTPGKTADVNKTHVFTYALFPHAGSYTNGVVRAAYELNVPVTAETVAGSRGRLPPVAEWISVSGDNVVIDTVKKAEDDGALIVRLYEAHACRGRRLLRIGLPVERVIETDLVEREERPLRIRNGRVTLDFRPFQIRTLKLLRT